jgi:hypothetical protein
MPSKGKNSMGPIFPLWPIFSSELARKVGNTGDCTPRVYYALAGERPLSFYTIVSSDFLLRFCLKLPVYVVIVIFLLIFSHFFFAFE